MGRKTLATLIFISFFILAPFFKEPQLLLSRGNDLEEVFWPVFYTVRSNFIQTGQIPLWNNSFFSGTPILPDPQTSLFYPINILFYLLPTDQAIISHIFVHILLGAAFMYLLCKKGLNLSNIPSLFAAIVFVLNPKVISFLEAGHITMISASAWLPLIALSLIFIIKKPDFKWALLFAVGLAGTFYNHTLIFVFSIFFSLVPLPLIIFGRPNSRIKSIIFFFLGTAMAFGLTAITLLPQIEWSSYTTRSLLIQSPDVYPKWSSKKEFLESLIVPNFETEKNIAFGIFVLFLAAFGYLKCNGEHKMLIALTSVGIILVSLNNASPLYFILTKQNWFALLRVSTRIWPFLLLFVIPLSAYGLEKLIKIKRWFFVFFSLLAILELFFWRNEILQKEVQRPLLAPDSVYEYLSKDEGLFRVFCITHCLSQKKSAQYGLELVEGYNTLQQKNYYQHTWQMMGGYWNYYTLALPPFGAFLYDKIQPNAVSLGEYNTKYVISTYTLDDQGFELLQKIDQFYVYKNNAYLERSSALVETYSPNLIRVNTKNLEAKNVTLREVWSPGWKAYLNGFEETEVLETPNAQRLVNIKKGTEFVDFVYRPGSYERGRIITLLTVAVILLYLSYTHFSKKMSR